MQKTIPELLADNLVEKLLKQDRRTHDRDWDEDWQEFDNFGEFYEAWKHHFIMPFSTPERLAARVMRIYLFRQLSAVVQREEEVKTSDAEFERHDRLLADAIAARFDDFIHILQTQWPKEWEDMVRRSAALRV